MIVCVLGYCVLALSFHIAIANEANAVSESAKIESYIASLYRSIDFGNNERLSYTVFNHALRGYLNLKDAGKLQGEREVITICDLNQPSVFNRLWVIDLGEKRVLYNSYVAHGQNTGEDCAMKFSNKMNSHQSSLGFYVTADVYDGEHGTSLHLEGVDQGFNDAALERDIVVHGAEYVSDKYIAENQRLGRSWGCPAVPVKLAVPIINTIKEGTCLFIYYPDTKYLANSYWLNRKMGHLPDQHVQDMMTPLELERPHVRTIQYMHNGKIDSVRKLPTEQ